jgi:hypothetical protein
VNRRTQLMAAWCGPAFGVLFLIGLVALALFIPPFARPQFSARHIAALYAAHTTRIRLGVFVACIGSSLVAPWGCVIAAQLRPTEGGFPILTYICLISAAIATTALVLSCCCWGVTAFRPGQTSPQNTQFSNDLAWIVFLLTWPPFTVWGRAVGIAVFTDPGDRPVYPRWLGYLSLWVALLIVPAGLLIFFKHGAFSWAGLITLYVPAAAFFVWMISLTIRNIEGGRVYTRDVAPAGS